MHLCQTDVKWAGCEQPSTRCHSAHLCAVLAVPYTHFWKLLIDHAGLSRITETDGWLAVKTMNDVGHLN